MVRGGGGAVLKSVWGSLYVWVQWEVIDTEGSALEKDCGTLVPYSLCLVAAMVC